MLHKHRPEWGTHIPVLINALRQSEGDVLELGLGISSTPLLHMLCADQDRKLFSFDNDETFIEMFKKYRSGSHQIDLVTDWDSILVRDYGVVFIDHKPDYRRKYDAEKFRNAEFVVLHDSEPNGLYDYEAIYPLFEFRYDYTKFPTHTTVLSNKKSYVHY
jgi:hypothetical protein